MNNVVSLLDPNAPQECAACGEEAARLIHRIEKFPYLQGEDQVMLEARVPVWECGACSTSFTEGDAEEIRHAAVCHHLGRLTPAEVRAIREQYKLSQQEWAERTGLGAASIKRWETGNLIQSEGYDRYLRLLRHPDILARASEIAEQPNANARGYRFQTDFSAAVLQQASVFELRKRRA
jgi:putative zinc finger/helix-turn-helix YgiT family protein